MGCTVLRLQRCGHALDPEARLEALDNDVIDTVSDTLGNTAGRFVRTCARRTSRCRPTEVLQFVRKGT